ncbi:MFS transporter [Azotobacter vinelandii CA]|uniref:MFS transporter n=2 Tax=Azotobacter vinelandii TaxID=354 RepID=C1DDL6_AZOVD|nr:MFS transporter [Azotobacter vinelandii]ACO77987.1 MFS transporter [Azotobacter vinelandii DJ]AGK16903.1 MFS transporter [Azotobacter vinelandii CA]AGK20149.1 MFS transporter [Azotobacter vinelandii CA6]SFX91957.1 Predicted arabinose efflux permease, MFS family [Azotobacter vinelandii]GLK61942.1 MFS transporter [Azotobacter vinelandii]
MNQSQHSPGAVSDSRQPASTTVAERLPLSALLALAMTGFIAILTETLPAGLLPQLGRGLDISQALAGQLVSAYALGSLVAAIPLITLTAGWRRKPLLLLAIGGFLLFNSITALSSSYPLTLLARFLAGVAAGLAWGLLAGHARRMVAAPLQGRAMAIAMVGTPLALSLGVPAGTWLGALVGWRMAFGLMSGLTLILAVWVLRKVPDFPGRAAERRLGIRQVFAIPGVRPVLLVILLWVLAHNILYTYIAPFLAPAGMSTSVDRILLVFGASALLGIWIVGLLIDRWLRALVLLSLGGFALASLALGFGGTQPAVVHAGVAVWGLIFGGAATLLQTASADAAGEGADLAQSMIVTVWNLAIAGGGVFGGLLLETAGVGAFPWVLLGLLAAALLCAGMARTHGFRAEPRQVRAD